MIPLLYLIGCPNIGNSDERSQAMDNEHLDNMQKNSSWFIETAIGQYYVRKGKEVYKRRPGDPGWLKLCPDVVWIYDYLRIQGYAWGAPEIEENRTIARCRQAFGGNNNVFNETECFLRTEFKGEIYEYWVVKEWIPGIFVQAKFVIAKAPTLDGKREIIHTADQFIDKYDIDKDFSVVFPVDNLGILYNLKAWDFPDNYKNSNLNEFIVGFSDKAVEKFDRGESIKDMPDKYLFEKFPWPPPKRFWEFWK